MTMTTRPTRMKEGPRPGLNTNPLDAILFAHRKRNPRSPEGHCGQTHSASNRILVVFRSAVLDHRMHPMDFLGV